MTDYDAMWIARQCQTLARRLAPLQNAVEVTAAAPSGTGRRPPPLRRLWAALGLVAPPLPAPPAVLSAETMGQIVSNLLSAGNILEILVKERKAT